MSLVEASNSTHWADFSNCIDEEPAEIEEFHEEKSQMTALYKVNGITKQDNNYIKLIQDSDEHYELMQKNCAEHYKLMRKKWVEHYDLMHKKWDEHYKLMQKNCAEHYKFMREMCAKHEHLLRRERFLNLAHAQSMQDIASANKISLQRTTSVPDIKALNATVVSFLAAEGPAKKSKFAKFAGVLKNAKKALQNAAMKLVICH